MAKVLISGWYGFGNLGDEAILYAISRSLLLEIPNISICALSFDPLFTERYQQIPSAPQLPAGVKSWCKALLSGDICRTINAIIESDILLLGGGGFLSDWQPEAPWIWLRQALIAKLFGKKVMLYGIGAGPFRRKLGRWITRKIVNHCVDEVTVRDDESKNWLISAGVYPGKIQVTADPALRYPVSPNSFINDTAPVKVGICIAPVFHSEKFWPGKLYKYQRYVDTMYQVVSGLIENGFTVQFIPMQQNNDSVFAREILKNLSREVEIIKPLASLDQAVAQLAGVDILITMRYHAAILGTLQGIPILPIIYHHKVSEFINKIEMREFAEELGDGSNWRESDIDPERLIKSIITIAENYPQVKDRMVNALKRMQIAEHENVRTLAVLLEECH